MLNVCGLTSFSLALGIDIVHVTWQLVRNTWQMMCDVLQAGIRDVPTESGGCHTNQ